MWDGADGASIPDALGGLGASAGGSDVSAQVGVIYQWVAETQTLAQPPPRAPPAFVIAFDTFTRGASLLDSVERSRRVDGRRGAG